MTSAKSQDNMPQLEKFEELSRALDCDESEANFDARLREVAKHKSVHEKPE